MRMRRMLATVVLAGLAVAQSAMMLPRVDGQQALKYTAEVVAFGPRYLGSPGHAKTEQYIKEKLKGDDLEVDAFTMRTPEGPKTMRNYIAKYPGTKEGIVVVAGHYDTLYGRKDFVGANDGGSSTGLLLALADHLRGKKLNGYSVWLVWLDGEEAIKEWSDTDSLYGSRHLATKWKADETAKRVKAFILEDMNGGKNLRIEDDKNSSAALRKMVYEAAQSYGTQSHFFGRPNEVGDDHVPFAKLGIPTVDLIDFSSQGTYWHTPQDTMDKLSAESLQMVGDATLETIQLLGVRGGVDD